MDYATFIADPVIEAAGFSRVLTYSTELVTQIITEVSCLLPQSRWARNCTNCDKRELAIKYLTAHRLTVLTQSGIIGPNATQTAGLISGQISSLSASQGSQSVSFTAAPATTSGAGWLAEGQTPTYWWNLFLGVAQARVVAIGFTV